MADVDWSAVEAEVTGRVLDELKLQFKDAWDKLEPEVKTGLREAAVALAKLSVRALKGEDVSELKKHVEAQLANLSVIVEDTALKNFWIAAYKTVGIAGELLGNFIKGALIGALGGAVA